MRGALSASWLTIVLLCSVAMQRPAVGQAAPLLEMRDLQGVARSLKDYAGPKGIVIFFWAGWSDRSVEELKTLDAEQKTLKEHGVGIVAVNVEHQAAGEAELKPVKEKVAALGVTLPVIVDEGLTLFKAYGVVSVPSTALVNEKGELASFFSGYSAGQREALFDAIEKLAGITREKVVVEVPKGAPAAVRRFEMGRSQLAAGRVSAARSSFEAAATADPAFPDPIVDLAAIALDEGDQATAAPLIEKALAIDGRLRGALVEQARLLAVAGKVPDAVAALQPIAAQAGPESVAAAYLAVLQTVASGQTTPAQALADMAARRRQLAAKR